MGKLEGKTALVTGGNSGIGLATAKSGRKDGAGLARFTERFAKVNGVRLRYLIGGQGSAVVLLHGYAETGDMWSPIMPSLATRHTVIVPDLRGAGGSAKPASGYDKKTMAVDIHELTRSLKFDRVSIVGHDIGLMVAYVYAAQFPQTTERVILMDAFLPGIGDWKHVWLLRDLWHFHFHGGGALGREKRPGGHYLQPLLQHLAAHPKRPRPEGERPLGARAGAQPRPPPRRVQTCRTSC